MVAMKNEKLEKSKKIKFQTSFTFTIYWDL